MGGRGRTRLAGEVHGVQAHDVVVAQLAQQHHLADCRGRHALALAPRLEGLDGERARELRPGPRQVDDAVGALPDLGDNVEERCEVGRRALRTAATAGLCCRPAQVSLERLGSPPYAPSTARSAHFGSQRLRGQPPVLVHAQACVSTGKYTT